MHDKIEYIGNTRLHEEKCIVTVQLSFGSGFLQLEQHSCLPQLVTDAISAQRQSGGGTMSRMFF